MAIGRAVLQSIPNAETLAKLADSWQLAPDTEAEAKRTALITRLANDVALRSYTLTRDRIDELRAANLDDAQILDVVVTAALWSAAARLEVLTGCLPALAPRDEIAKEAIPSPISAAVAANTDRRGAEAAATREDQVQSALREELAV